MYYHKIILEDQIIEFHNNWLGEELVIVNGQLVSKKFSMLGTDHPFDLVEDGRKVHYILSVRMDMMSQVSLDLRRDGQIILHGQPVKFGGRPRKPKNTDKIKGLAALNTYDLDDAIILLDKALLFDATDPEIHFHLACAHSVQENLPEAYEHLRLAVQKKLKDVDAILSHDMLAYVRMSLPFEDFFESNYTRYDLSEDPSGD